MQKFSLILLISLISLFSLQGQDIHFSQFYSVPTLMNPASTGNISGDYRVGLHNKSHFFNQANQFQTVAAFGDVTLLQGELLRESWLGIGMQVYYDDAGSGRLQTLGGGPTVAFHKALISEKLYLSGGMGFVFTRKQFDLDDLTYNSQYSEQGFTLASGESFENVEANYLDVSAGLNLSYTVTRDTRVNLGAAFLHVNKPRESLYFNDNVIGNNTRNIRPAISLTADIGLANWGLHPGAFYSTSNNAQEVILGSNFSYTLVQSEDTPTKAYIGAWYRMGEAAILAGGFEVQGFRLLLSYDLNTETLRENSPNRKGFEISLIHFGRFRPAPSKMHCPRF